MFVLQNVWESDPQVKIFLLKTEEATWPVDYVTLLNQ